MTVEADRLKQKKAIDKIQHPFIIKKNPLRKRDREENFLNLTKTIHKNNLQLIFNGANLDAFL